MYDCTILRGTSEWCTPTRSICCLETLCSGVLGEAGHVRCVDIVFLRKERKEEEKKMSDEEADKTETPASHSEKDGEEEDDEETNSSAQDDDSIENSAGLGRIQAGTAPRGTKGEFCSRIIQGYENADFLILID